MGLWQTLFRFGNVHSRLLRFIAAILALPWVGRMIRSFWRFCEDELVAGCVTGQVNPGPFESDKRGFSPSVQKDCSSLKIAEILSIKPARARTVLERLQTQQRVKQRRKSDMWSATPYQTRQPIRRWVKMWLDHLERKNDKLKKKDHI